MANVKNVAPGVGLCAAIAIPCWFLGEALPVVGGPVFAILIGMVIALFWKDQKAAKSGITYTSKKILQLAVVLLGFGNLVFLIYDFATTRLIGAYINWFRPKVLRRFK